MTHQGHKTGSHFTPPPSVCATHLLLTQSASLFVFFHAFVFLPCPQQQRGWVGFSNAVRLRNSNHGKGDIQYSLRPQRAATGCVQSPYCWRMSLALKIDPQNALFLLQKLNPTHKIHGFCISISWPPSCVCATLLLSTDSCFCSFWFICRTQ